MTPLGLRRKTSFSFFILIFIWALGFTWFYSQIPNTKTTFKENTADAIVVLTGDSGRLEYGIELLAQQAAPVLYISGAGERVKISDLLQRTPIETRKKIDETNIVIGNQAENTIGNAEEIKSLMTDKKYKSFLLVTSSYHMPRSLLELSATMPHIAITPAPVIDKDNELLFSEYNKYLASKLRHLFLSVSKEK